MNASPSGQSTKMGNASPYIREIVDAVVNLIAIRDTFNLSCVDRGLFHLLRQEDAHLVYQQNYCDTELLVFGLMGIVKTLRSSGPVVYNTKQYEKKWDKITTNIKQLCLPNKFNLYVWGKISNNVCTYTDFMRAIVCGDVVTIKQVKLSLVEDQFVSYLVAIARGQCEIVKILIDWSTFNPSWNNVCALTFACATQNIEMINIVIHHCQQFVWEAGNWESALAKCAHRVASVDVYVILMRELKRVSPGDFYPRLVSCICPDYNHFTKQSRLRELYYVSCQIFDNNEIWIDMFIDKVAKNLTLGCYTQVKELFEIDGAILPRHKHKLLAAIYDGRWRKFYNQGNDADEIVKLVLNDKRFDWNVCEELKCSDDDHEGCYELLQLHSNYTRKFLRDHSVPPVFFATSFYTLFNDIDTLKYVLNDKTSQTISYHLAHIDVCNDIYHTTNPNSISPTLRILLDDGRANFVAHQNRFLARLITDNQFEIISMLIDSGKIFFPLCLRDIRAYSKTTVRFFAKHETYFKQINEQFKDAEDNSHFVKEIINFHK